MKQNLAARLTRSTLLFAPVLAALPLVSACASAPIRMSVPTSLATAPELEVSGQQSWSRLTGKPVAFGEYRAEEVKLGWASTTRSRSGFGMGLSVGNKRLTADEEKVKFRQKLQFRLVAPGAAEVWVHCLRAEDGESVVFERQTPKSESTTRVREYLDVSLACTAEASDGSTWTLALDSRDPRFLDGALIVGDKTFTVEPSKLVASPRAERGVARIPAAAGYLIETQGQSAAAVELFTPGRVRIEPSLPVEDRAALAGAAVALMLLAG